MVENYLVPIFLNLQSIIKGGGSNKLTSMLVDSLTTVGGLFDCDFGIETNIIWCK
jgi:hypothetical protein